MASNRFPSSTSRMRQLLTPHPPRPFLLSLQSMIQPAGVPTPSGVSARLKSDSMQASNPWPKPWTGSTTEDHAINRVKRRDITDPQMESTLAGQEEREEVEGIADASKSHSTTERDLRRSSERAEKEHPHAPKPMIGVNDERGEVSSSYSILCTSYIRSAIWLGDWRLK